MSFQCPPFHLYVLLVLPFGWSLSLIALLLGRTKGLDDGHDCIPAQGLIVNAVLVTSPMREYQYNDGKSE